MAGSNINKRGNPKFNMVKSELRDFGLEMEKDELPTEDSSFHLEGERATRVMVNKVPPEINEQALVALCFKLTGFQPIDCYKQRALEGRQENFSWAILEFAEAKHAAVAISKLNNNELHSFEAVQGRSYFDQQVFTKRPTPEFVDEEMNFNAKENYKASNADTEANKTAEVPHSKTVGQGFKLTPHGVAISNPGNGHFGAPIFNADPRNGFDREEPVDSLGHFSGCYYEPLNSVLRYVEANRTHPSKSVPGTQLSSSDCDEYVLKELNGRVDVDPNWGEGQFNSCWVCARMTPILCLQCGKPFCCVECVNSSTEHANGTCQGQFSVPMQWQGKFAALKCGLGLDANHPDTTESSSSSTMSSFKAAGIHLSDYLSLEETFELAIQCIIKEFGEPSAFACNLVEVTDSYSQMLEENSLVLVGILETTTIPLAEVWKNFIEDGKTIRVICRGLGEDFVVGDLLHQLETIGRLTLRLCRCLDNTVLDQEPPAVKDGCEVALTYYCSSNLCYLRKWLRDDRDSLLDFDVDFVVKTSEPMNAAPDLGQLVLIQSCLNGSSQRAQITALPHENQVLVHLIDEGSKELVPFNRIFPITDKLRLAPARAVLFELTAVPDRPLTPEALKYMNRLSDKKSKLHLKLDAKGLANLVAADSGDDVNGKLSEMLHYSWDRKLIPGEIIPSVFAKSLSDFETLPEGKSNLIVLKVNGLELICCRSDSPTFNSVLKLLPEMAEEYVDSCPLNWYAPKREELVLVQSSRDLLWYRALVTDIHSGAADVVFLDFCSSEDLIVPYSRMRKLPYEMAYVPPLGVIVTIIGIDDSLGAEEIGRFVQPGAVIESFVFNADEDSALVLLPDVLQQLVYKGVITKQSIQKNLSNVKLSGDASLVIENFIKALSSAEFDVNQNLLTLHQTEPQVSSMALKYMDRCLDEVAQEVVAELASGAKQDLEHYTLASLKMDFFWNMQSFVKKNEEKQKELLQREEEGSAKGPSSKSLLLKLLANRSPVK